MLNAEQREYLIPKAYNAAVRAGAAILDIYNAGGDVEVDLKRDLSPITQADRDAHLVIKEYLGPTHIPLLSEEGREMRFDERRDWDMFWLVDPLDGTKEFLRRTGEFTVNIALVIDNRPVVGVIYVPVLGKMYFCEKGRGSFSKQNVAPDRAAEFTYEEIFAGAVELPLKKERNNPLRIAVSRSHKNDETMARVDRIRRDHPDAEVVEQGSSYKFCMLAEGDVDCYVRTSDTYEWDTAAGEIILSETGGTTSPIFGTPPQPGAGPDPGPEKFAYNKESLLNPWFFCRSRHFQEM